jgi:hypothetical protein
LSTSSVRSSLDVWPLVSGANTTSPRTEVPLACLPGVAATAAAAEQFDENVFRDPMYFTGADAPDDFWRHSLIAKTIICQDRLRTSIIKRS